MSHATPITPKDESKLNRSIAIDALRGAAALMVVVYHARSSLWVGLRSTYDQYGVSLNINALMGYLSIPFSFGGLGVTLFFVLSGYCIHRRGARQIAAGRVGDMNWGTFTKRRLLRIYPTYICALLLTAGIDYWLSTYHGGSTEGQDNSAYAFLASLLTLQGFAAPFFGSNGVFWTLAMEIHLYAAYPVLFYMSAKFGPVRVVLMTLAISLGYSVGQTLFNFECLLPHRFQRGPIFLPYWFTWTAGFYLAEIEAGRCRDLPKRVWPVIACVSMIIGMILTTLGAYLFAEVFCAIGFAGLVKASLSSKAETIAKRLEVRLLAMVGVFSYSLYAIHAPILKAYHTLLSSESEADRFPTLWPAIGGIALVIPISYIFFLLVETWSIKTSSAKPSSRESHQGPRQDVRET